MKTLKCNECGCEFDVPDETPDNEVELCPRCESLNEEGDEDTVITGEEDHPERDTDVGDR